MRKKPFSFARVFAAFLAVCLAGFGLLPALSASAREVEYEIVFRTGSHGTFDGVDGSSVTFTVPYQEAFPDVPDVVPEDGYVFKGWSAELPAVGSPVTGRQVFVAKYGVLVAGREYKVRYVNDADVDLLTAKVTLAENGSTVTERAKTIEGYAADETQKSVVIGDGENVITFVYRSTAVPPAPSSSEPANTTSSNQAGTTPTPGGDGQTTSSETASGGESSTTSGGTVSVPDESVPQGDEPITNIDDSQVPLADKPGSFAGQMGIWIGAGAAILLLGGGIVLLVLRKKKKQAD